MLGFLWQNSDLGDTKSANCLDEDGHVRMHPGDPARIQRRENMADYRVVVVPYDFSEHARAALHEAAKLSRRLDADLHLLHVVQ